MKQPEPWSSYAARILTTGARPHFAPEAETLEVHARVIPAEAACCRCASSRRWALRP